MANINKISVAGTIYDLQDQHASKTVELTQAEYNGLAVKDPNTFYIITDAQGGDLSNYYTKGETDTLLGGKQPTLVSGTNIKTINNESLLGEGNIDIQGGGGKAIEAGRGISITAGETADTVSFNLPIYVGTGEGSVIGGFSENTASGKYSIALGGRYESQYDYQYCQATGKGAISFGGTASGQGAFSCGENPKAIGTNSVAFGDSTEAKGVESFAIGRNTSANTFVSFTQGMYTKATNDAEVAFGEYNKSVSASTNWGDSGNTLFSVGNGTGTADGARHNAFEIRQNGDIYCSDGTNDVKLQDTITATTANTTALGGLKLVKLTQAEYDALQTKDASTLYIIVN